MPVASAGGAGSGGAACGTNAASGVVIGRRSAAAAAAAAGATATTKTRPSQQRQQQKPLPWLLFVLAPAVAGAFASAVVLLGRFVVLFVALFDSCQQQRQQEAAAARKKGTDGGADDLALARVLQERLHADAMSESNLGRAWTFVERVFRVHSEIRDFVGESLVVAAKAASANAEAPQSKMCRYLEYGGYVFDTVAKDDMVFMAERMLDLRSAASFRNNGTENCSVVDLGFHYTLTENLEHIRTVRLVRFFFIVTYIYIS